MRTSATQHSKLVYLWIDEDRYIPVPVSVLRGLVVRRDHFERFIEDDKPAIDKLVSNVNILEPEDVVAERLEDYYAGRLHIIMVGARVAITLPRTGIVVYMGTDTCGVEVNSLVSSHIDAVFDEECSRLESLLSKFGIVVMPASSELPMVEPQLLAADG